MSMMTLFSLKSEKNDIKIGLKNLTFEIKNSNDIKNLIWKI